jgi:SAM-dependent methyltransferase
MAVTQNDRAPVTRGTAKNFYAFCASERWDTIQALAERAFVLCPAFFRAGRRPDLIKLTTHFPVGGLIMADDIRHIHGYYSPNDLYNKIIQGLHNLGKDLSKVTLDDLLPVDEFHIRGKTATQELIQLSGFTSGMHILDVGCGVGGSTRRLSHEVGCRVTGIDLSDQYIDAAERLTQLFNMQERVKFHAASALELPFDDNTFDGAWSIQMNMNIEDKLTWLREMKRVIKPGGRVVLYELCAHKNSPVYFPVPWAQNSSMSFLVSPEAFRDVITSAGLEIAVWHDKTSLAKIAFSEMTEPKGEPDLPELGTHLLVGKDILTKAYNLRRNLFEERVSLIETAAVKPD